MQRYSSTDFECFKAFSSQKPFQASQKPTALCNALQACFLAHVNVDEHCFFYTNMFLSLLPPSTMAQCLATNFTSIMELTAFADQVHCQSAVVTLAAINPEPNVDLACATAVRKDPMPPATPPAKSALCFYH